MTQADVEQDHVRQQFPGLRQRAGRIAGFADDFVAVELRQQAPQPLARQRFVVNNQHFHASAVFGMRKAARKILSSTPVSSDARSP